MHWKVLLIALVIITIFSVVLIQYTDWEIFDGLRNQLGQAVSVINIFQPKGSYFSIALKVSGENLYSTTYKVNNATLYISGFKNIMRIDNKDIGLQAERKMELTLKNLIGEFSILGNGNIRVNGRVAGLEMDDIIFPSSRVYLEMVPGRFSLINYEKDKIVFESISGQIERYEGEQVSSVVLSNDWVEIYNFKGTIKMDGNEITLLGVTNLVKGNDFTFGA